MSNTEFIFNEQVQKVRQLLAQEGEQGWDKLWRLGTTPWDVGHPQPALENLLKSKEVDFPSVGKALVPGCGKGYDVWVIAKNLGLETIGIDISPMAVALANETLKNDPSEPSNVKFEVGDFFKLEGTFNLVYDFKFFQALPLSVRADWGKKMTSITQYGGYLIILVHPLGIPKDVGPPYGTDENTHREVLGTGWEKLVDRPVEENGRRQIMVWQRVV